MLNHQLSSLFEQKLFCDSRKLFREIKNFLTNPLLSKLHLKCKQYKSNHRKLINKMYLEISVLNFYSERVFLKCIPFYFSFATSPNSKTFLSKRSLKVSSHETISCFAKVSLSSFLINTIIDR